MENPIKMDDLGGTPPIFGNTHILKIQVIHGCIWGRGVATVPIGRYTHPDPPDPAQKLAYLP